MIDHNLQLKIQAFLDAELSEPEARDVAALIAANPEASALHAELRAASLRPDRAAARSIGEPRPEGGGG